MKGFGSIVAEVSGRIAAAQERDNPLCPLCGYPMERGCTPTRIWFCYGGRDDHAAWLNNAERRERAFAAQRRGEVVKWVDLQTPPPYRWQNWDGSMQACILAVTDSGWAFITVRGGWGATNFKIEALNVHQDMRDVPIPKPEDWQWASWIGELPARPECPEEE